MSCQNDKELTEVQIPVRNTFIKESEFPDPSLIKTKQGPFEMEGLSFKYDQIPDFLSASCIELHYSKHHLQYANSLNQAIEQYGVTQHNLESILKSPSSFNTSLVDYAGGFYNHNLYWKSIDTQSNLAPSQIFTQRLVSDLGGLKEFENKFLKAAEQLIGSGWIWLVYNQGALEIVTTKDNHTPFKDPEYHNAIPLLALDLWEHAYYLTYQNNKDKYITAFIEHIDWPYISSRFESHIE